MHALEDVPAQEGRRRTHVGQLQRSAVSAGSCHGALPMLLHSLDHMPAPGGLSALVVGALKAQDALGAEDVGALVLRGVCGAQPAAAGVS